MISPWVSPFNILPFFTRHEILNSGDDAISLGDDEYGIFHFSPKNLEVSFVKGAALTTLESMQPLIDRPLYIPFGSMVQTLQSGIARASSSHNTLQIVRPTLTITKNGITTRFPLAEYYYSLAAGGEIDIDINNSAGLSIHKAEAIRKRY